MGLFDKGDAKNYPALAYLHMTKPWKELANGHQAKQINPLGHFRQLWTGPFISASAYSSTVENAFDMAERQMI